MLTEEILNGTLKTSEHLKETYDYLLSNDHLKRDFFKYEDNLLKQFIKNADIDVNSDVPLSRIKGAFLGCAVGDALGRYLEGAPVGLMYLEEYPWTETGDPGEGYISDDTQMTMCLGLSILDNAGLNPKDIATRFAYSKIRGLGAATRQFISSFRQGAPWYSSGVDSAGNGVAMRCSPIGIFYAKDYESLRIGSIIQAMITHNNSMAIASGIVSALAVSLLTRMDPGYLDSMENKVEFCRVLAESVKGIEDGDIYKTRNTGKVDSLYNRLENTIPKFLKENVTPEEADKILFSGAYVLESQPIALYSFLLTPGDFRQTLLNSVNYSHDSDTVGAIACAMSGAYNSDSAIEAKFLDTLEHRDHITAMACGFGK